ncbi:lymphocyte antigen 75-like [Haliotis cracherodii]|uniref:lymphocyte antigen 75-like n=1 Tax=Haliotis cracherodii TaxID=6455 RepID=UPI0039E8D2F5
MTSVSFALSVVFSGMLQPGLDSSSASSQTDCIVQCFYNEYCNSVFYDSGTFLCHFGRDNYDSPTSTMTAEASVVYVIVKSGNLKVVGPQSECPLDEGFAYDSAADICYKVLETLTTADSHRATCQAMGGQLMAVTSAARDTFLTDQTAVYNGGFFFGARYDGSQWTWETGAPYGDYLNWETGNPDDANPCGRKNKGTPLWRSFACDKGLLYSVCEFVTGYSQAQLTTCIP